MSKEGIITYKDIVKIGRKKVSPTHINQLERFGEDNLAFQTHQILSSYENPLYELPKLLMDITWETSMKFEHKL